VKHWQDIFNLKKEKHRNLASKDKRKRFAGRSRDHPQVVLNSFCGCQHFLLFGLINGMIKWLEVTQYIIDIIDF